MQTLLKHIQVAPKDGLKQTLAIMNDLERLSFNRPDFVKFVFEKFSSDCQACTPGKIWKYIQENFKYVSDEPFDEIITAPYILKNTKHGDCDDFSLFAKTCIDMLGGFNSHYILFSKEKNNFSHVAVFVHRGIFNNTFIDGVIIDGANNNFNVIPDQYNFYKLI